MKKLHIFVVELFYFYKSFLKHTVHLIMINFKLNVSFLFFNVVNTKIVIIKISNN